MRFQFRWFGEQTPWGEQVGDRPRLGHTLPINYLGLLKALCQHTIWEAMAVFCLNTSRQIDLPHSQKTPKSFFWTERRYPVWIQLSFGHFLECIC